MRARLRTWPVLVYRYAVQLYDPANPDQRLRNNALPAALLQEADRMQALWNQLCDAYNNYRQASQELMTSDAAVTPLVKKLQEANSALDEARSALKLARRRVHAIRHPELSPFEEAVTAAKHVRAQHLNDLNEARRSARNRLIGELKELRNRFNRAVVEIVSTCPITWCHREYVKEKFLRALNILRSKGGSGPQPNFSDPRALHFHYRFSGGGLLIEHPIRGAKIVKTGWMFGRNKRVNMRTVSEIAFDPDLTKGQRKSLIRTQAIFSVAGITLPLTVYFHRPLPQGSYLKAGTLVGRQIHGPGYRCGESVGEVTPARWEWSLQLTLEVPPTEPATITRSERIGALDLGYRLVNESSLRIGVVGSSDGYLEELRLPEKIVRAFQYKRDLESQRDKVLQEMKEALRRVAWPDPLPAQAAAIQQRLTLVRSTGLRTLLRLFETHRLIGPAVDLLQTWAEQTSSSNRELHGLQARYRRHREWYYRNLAARLCRQYSTLIVEDLNLKDMVRIDKREHPSLAMGAMYRNLAALSRFLSCLEQAAAKHGTRLIRVNPMYSTRTCSICQAVLKEAGPEVMLKCPNGHLWDQDENAVKNLLRMGLHEAVPVR